MTIEWFDPEVKLPEHEQECLLMPHEHGGLITVGVYGPIRYDDKLKVWCDLFRDSEAGSIVGPADVGCWTWWLPIAPPDGLPTPRKKKT